MNALKPTEGDEDAFGALALRVGAVSPDDLRRARQTLRAKEGRRTLEEVLLRQGSLSRPLARLVRAHLEAMHEDEELVARN